MVENTTEDMLFRDLKHASTSVLYDIEDAVHGAESFEDFKKKATENLLRLRDEALYWIERVQKL